MVRLTTLIRYSDFFLSKFISLETRAGLPERCGNWKIGCFHFKASVQLVCRLHKSLKARLKHHTRMTPFLLGGGFHILPLIFFVVCF